VSSTALTSLVAAGELIADKEYRQSRARRLAEEPYVDCPRHAGRWDPIQGW
jgi:hypothetical protein